MNHADVKWNNGEGALLCNGCGVVLATGFDHEDREHYCSLCMSGKCQTKYREEIDYKGKK